MQSFSQDPIQAAIDAENLALEIADSTGVDVPTALALVHGESAASATKPAAPSTASSPAPAAKPPVSPQGTYQGYTAPVMSRVNDRLKMAAPVKVDSLLVEILSTKRAHMTASEIEFTKTWLPKKINELGFAPMWKSDNLVVVVPATGKQGMPDTLFSCHVDTCHRTTGTQQLDYDANYGLISVRDKDAECLGADDGVGVWIMLRMVEAKVPGVYVFHRGEERGCIGSRQLACEHKDWLSEFSASIAFDRPRFDEVITHQQGGTRFASDDFGRALATALNTLSGGKFAYRISQNGVVTDNAFYGEYVAENVNLGVGYVGQHGPDESLDYAHAELLLQCCLSLDWQSLPIVRKPEPVKRFGSYSGGHTGYWGGQAPVGAPPAAAPKGGAKKKKPKGNTLTQAALFPDSMDIADELESCTVSEIAEWLRESPRAGAVAIAQLLADLRAEQSRYSTLRTMWLSDQ